MKKMVNSATIILLGLVFSGGIILAQEQTQSDQPKPGTQMIKPVFTEEQKAMLKNDLQKRKEIREAFKATLSQEQRDMLTDPRVMPSDRKKSFRASLTDQQVKMIKARQHEIKNARNHLRSTMSIEQRMQFRKMVVNRARMNSFIFRRARLRNRLSGI